MASYFVEAMCRPRTVKPVLWNQAVKYGNATLMTKWFNAKTKELLSELATQAYTNPKMYAAGEMELYGSKKLYGLTQCTRDLSSTECKKCLDGIIGELPSCCDGKE
ncbi:hypothetical protein J1N35_038936 [Gossypium stocksii]|uniref:Gnk2-homologous domain-containing protein n=1 Tax=Gossypium stocksii TaxID=47602 RepID=A0A9D3ZNA3_9ROSI|nr:hypothetical protein J1N35_038936 [Gossypium stocksii]